MRKMATWSPKMEHRRVPKRTDAQALRLWCDFSLNLLFPTHILLFPSHLKYLICGFNHIADIILYLAF